MSGRRKVADGLPYRVFQRVGVRIYSIGYMLPSGKWAYRYSCPVTDAGEVARIRAKAIADSTTITPAGAELPVGGFSGLIDAWLSWQASLPMNDTRKRAQSTIDGNRPEAKNLRRAWGHFEPHEITRTMGYDYLDACLTAKDPKGNPRPRPLKGNKEMSLAHLILEYGIRLKMLEANPLTNLTRNKIKKVKRLVLPHELALAVEMGRKIGGPQYVVAMGLQTAYLCVRRSVEVRAITRDAITEPGILWRDGKDKAKPAILIEWTPELRATIEETLKIKRNKVAGTMYLFGNMQGQKYTKGGWKSSLDDLMFPCVEEAAKRGIPFHRFSLQDCRPMAVTDKLTRGDKDTTESTGHTSDKMVATVYDRRPQRVATGARLAPGNTRK
jgi:integrase